MAANYVLLEKITVGAAGAASVTFNNIPQTGYTDLKVVWSVRTLNSSVNEDMCMRFNGSSASYSNKQLYGSGSAAASNSPFTDKIYIGSGTGNTATSNSFSNGETYIPNYTSSNYKSVSTDAVQETNASAAYMNLVAGLWSVTSAITTINIFPNSGTNFMQYSTFALYGLAAVGATPAIDPKATGGDIIQTDGTYWYHAFLSSGTFTPKLGLTCDVLVVGGGAGGGSNGGGGGGSGGALGFASQFISTSAQTITVGAGGAGDTTGIKGGSGTSSQFASLTAAIGGGGGGNLTASGVGGASGGGGGSSYGGGPGGAGATGTQGFNGATGFGGNTTVLGLSAGGGGGAGGNGATGIIGVGGVGGAGVTTVTNWGSLSTALTTLGLGVSGGLAGGGGGGSGTSVGSASSGGGTGGAGSTAALVGVPNTGGGGGGGGNPSTNGANGGSGVVIVRYTVA